MIAVSANVICADEAQATRIAEILSRVITGLALDGGMASLYVQVLEGSEESTPVGSDEDDGPS